jgi:hypothetical protein
MFLSGGLTGEELLSNSTHIVTVGLLLLVADCPEALYHGATSPSCSLSSSSQDGESLLARLSLIQNAIMGVAHSLCCVLQLKSKF